MTIYLLSFAELSGNDRRQLGWNCWPKQETMQHSRDCMAGRLTWAPGLIRKFPPERPQQSQIFIIGRQLQQLHSKNLYHIVSTRVRQECHRSPQFPVPVHFNTHQIPYQHLATIVVRTAVTVTILADLQVPPSIPAVPRDAQRAIHRVTMRTRFTFERAREVVAIFALKRKREKINNIN
jgi:hypothetical protein